MHSPNHLVFTSGLTHGNVSTIRICAMTVASVSIFAGLVFLYFFLMIHPTRRQFRHLLVALLLFFDFTKALAILIYTTRTHNRETELSASFVNGLGWVTVFGIEGADIIIFFFAVHMALLIFNKQAQCISNKFKYWMMKFTPLKIHPKRNNSDLTLNNEYNSNETIEQKLDSHGQSSMSEGGLYNHKYLVLLICFLFPILVTSISFYVHNTYQGYIHFVFFRVWTGPWYFTWILRHVVNFAIIVIYISIYIYVLMQFKKVSKAFKNRRIKEETNREGTSSTEDTNICDDRDDDEENNDNEMDAQNDGILVNTFGDSIWYKVFKMCSMLIFPDINITAKLHGYSLDTEEDIENINILKNDENTKEILDRDSISTNEILGLDAISPKINKTLISKQIQNLMYDEAMERFKIRKAQILNQMKIIFIYPISYLLIWLFPLINHYQIIRTKKETPWSTIAASICQPLNCLVDTCVFLIREKPWQLTKPLETTEMLMYANFDAVGGNINELSGYDIHGWRFYISGLPGYSYYGTTIPFESNTFEDLHKSEVAAYGRSDSVEVYDGVRRGSAISSSGSHNRMNPRFMSLSSTVEDMNSISGNSANLGQEEFDLKDFLNSKLQSSSTIKTVVSKPKPAVVLNKPGDKRQSFVSWKSRNSIGSSNFSKSTTSAGPETGVENSSHNFGVSNALKMTAVGQSKDTILDWNLSMFDASKSQATRSAMEKYVVEEGDEVEEDEEEDNDSFADEKIDIQDFLNPKNIL